MSINDNEGLAEGLNHFYDFKNAYKKEYSGFLVHRRLR